MIVHDMVNKLSAILGQCDLLIEVTEAGTEPANRLAVIRDIAESAAKELNEYQRKVATETRKAGKALGA